MPRGREPGAVVEIPLPNGRYAYARCYRDAVIGVYRETSDEPGRPPSAEQGFRFFVGVYDEAIGPGGRRVVGEDRFATPEDAWPPPMCIRDPITGELSLYHKGAMRAATAGECDGLEQAAVWEAGALVSRIMSTL